MTVETSTLNVLLGLVAGLQVWIVAKVYTLEKRLSLLASHCARCPYRDGNEND